MASDSFAADFQGGDRRVHHFVDDPARQRLDRDLLLRTQLSQPPSHAIDLRLPDSLEMVLQADNRWHHVQRLQTSLEAFHLAGDNRLGQFCFLVAVGDVARTACCRSSMS